MKSHEAVKVIFSIDMPQRARSVFLTIASFSNKENSCFPSIATIARRAHVSERSVQRALADLIALGMLKKEARFHANGGYLTNSYILSAGGAGLEKGGGCDDQSRSL